MNMALAITDVRLVAASSDANMPASNGNLINFSAVHDQKIISGQTPVDYYSNLVFSVGSEVSNSMAELDASQQVLQQLNDQRNSVSGVSLNEEAANLIQYQRAYDAAARIVSTVNEMLDTLIHLGQ